MPRFFQRTVFFLVVSLALLETLSAQEPPASDSAATAADGAGGSNVADEAETTEQLVERVRRSLVTIRITDRDGSQSGIGTGFVIDSAGLIATAWHVLHEGSPLTVELWPGKKLPVIAIEASDRDNDLALIRVDTGGAQIPALKLAPVESLQQGATVLAFGNPLGLEHSVVHGILSAVREIDGRPRLQVAMPIEFGNSGGPLVDRQGLVHGVINMKSAIDENLGFAIPVSGLVSLRQTPNPISYDRWVRLSGLDRECWSTVFGATWEERSGIIEVHGSGNGFGGRALCLSKIAHDKLPLELSVMVKLDDEAGAAGLVFGSDGEQKHYGFYPSNGELRLTCFRGADVFSWEVLGQVHSSHYRAGQWNLLTVKLDEASIECFVNGHRVLRSTDETFRQGKVGLAKFRDTNAQFKQFYAGPPIERQPPSLDYTQLLTRLAQQSEQMAILGDKDRNQLIENHPTSLQDLEKLALAAEAQARQLRLLAEEIRIAPILAELSVVLKSTDGDCLTHAALLIAKLDYPELPIDNYRQKLRHIAAEVRRQLPESSTASERLSKLDDYLFKENGYHGARQDYYHPANSQLNRVLEDREGMPLTLAMLYVELGRELEIPLFGIGLPGHFIVEYSDGDSSFYIDVFDAAKRLRRTEVLRLGFLNSGRPVEPTDLEHQTAQQMLTRMLRNLIGSSERQADEAALWRYVETLHVLQPEDPQTRLMRAIMRARTGRMARAAEDMEWFDHHPDSGVSRDDLLRLQIMIGRDQ